VRFCSQGSYSVDHALVLQSTVSGVEITIAFLKRTTKFLVITTFSQTIFDRISGGNLIQKAKGEIVFSFDPGCRLRGIKIFKPSIRVGDLNTVVIVHLFTLPWN